MHDRPFLMTATGPEQGQVAVIARFLYENRRIITG